MLRAFLHRKEMFGGTGGARAIISGMLLNRECSHQTHLNACSITGCNSKEVEIIEPSRHRVHMYSGGHSAKRKSGKEGEGEPRIGMRSWKKHVSRIQWDVNKILNENSQLVLNLFTIAMIGADIASPEFGTPISSCKHPH